MNCRSCGEATYSVFNLGCIPLVNNLLNSPDDVCPRYPLEVMFCDACLLTQIKQTIDPSAMFSEYAYYSTASPALVNDAEKLVKQLVDCHNPVNVMEIASNDGYLLQFWKREGATVLGVDPARGPANEAALRGIPTMQEFFTLKLAKTLPKMDIVHANNVLAHVPDLNDFVAGIAEVLRDVGIVVIEVPYLGSLAAKYAFDTFYHEHVYCFSYTALLRLLSRHGLSVCSVEELPTQGGSLRVIASKTAQRIRPTYMDRPDIRANVSKMQDEAIEISQELKYYLESLKRKGRSAWGFGASAKAAVMMNYAGIDNRLIRGVADSTPVKKGKFIPGTGIEIYSEAAWRAAQPDYTCIFSWNYAEYIKDKFCHLGYRGFFFTPFDI